jgi:tetratricopeptide (TPR) repeat protein
MNIENIRTSILCAALLMFQGLGVARAGETASFDSELRDIAQAWDHANFDKQESDARRSALEQVTQRATAFAEQYPQRPEALIWKGIALSSYAGAKGGLGALGLAKQSRESLQAALKLNPAALNGSAYTSLGVLYYKVPGFPLGFGNHDKARDYLQKALQLNPDGIDPNFFFGELMYEEGEYREALRYLNKAEAATPRAERPVADRGRHAEIAALLDKTNAKLR